MGRDGWRQGQGEARTSLLLFELIIVLVVLASLYYIVHENEGKTSHLDIDRELLAVAVKTLPQHMGVEGLEIEIERGTLDDGEDDA